MNFSFRLQPTFKLSRKTDSLNKNKRRKKIFFCLVSYGDDDEDDNGEKGVIGKKRERKLKKITFDLWHRFFSCTLPKPFFSLFESTIISFARASTFTVIFHCEIKRRFKRKLKRSKKMRDEMDFFCCFPFVC